MHGPGGSVGPVREDLWPITPGLLGGLNYETSLLEEQSIVYIATKYTKLSTS